MSAKRVRTAKEQAQKLRKDAEIEFIGKIK